MTTDTETLTYDDIAALALKHGFKLKQQADGRMALNDYVIDFARSARGCGGRCAVSVAGRPLQKHKRALGRQMVNHR